MSVIPVQIPPQAFEVVRDQLGAIIADELAKQVSFYQPYLKATVWRERFTPFEHDELPALNIMFVGGPTKSDDIKQQSGTYSYYIDAYFKAKASLDSELPDAAAAQKLHRMLGVIRAILMDARYKTLGFEPPFIARREVTNILIGDPGKMEGTSMVFGRLQIDVTVREIVDLKLPTVLKDYVTPVRLYSTDKGYIWSGSTP